MTTAVGSSTTQLPKGDVVMWLFARPRVLRVVLTCAHAVHDRRLAAFLTSP